jgi:mono/diheme cytochrome c family protein
MTRLAPALLALAALATLAACKRQDMATQDYSRTWDRNGFFADDRSMRHPVAGTVARADPFAPVAAPATISAAMLDDGRQHYEVFCLPCHGVGGNGDGMIVRRGFPAPPSLVQGKLRAAKAQRFYDAITHGYGAMYSFDTRVMPPDRWAIVAYIRALQLRQDAPAAILAESDRLRLAREP